MDKKIIVTLLFFIFSTGCGVTGMYVHDSKSEEDYSQDYRDCNNDPNLNFKEILPDEAYETLPGYGTQWNDGTMNMMSFQSCMNQSGWKFIDEKGNERDLMKDTSNMRTWSPKNKLSGPSRFQGF
jgi:hypothetical protein